MQRTSLTTAALLLLVPLAAGAQSDVVFYGRVTGSDQAAVVPPAWLVKIKVRYDTQKVAQEQLDSESDLFAYRAAVGRTFRLYFVADGYNIAVTDWIKVTSQGDVRRYRPDLVLEKIEPSMHVLSKGTAEDLKKKLEEQAAIAELCDSPDVLTTNVELYRQATSDRTSHGAAVKTFQGGDRFRRIEKVAIERGVSRKVVDNLMADEPTEPSILLEFVKNEHADPNLRARGIQALSKAQLDPAIKRQVVAYLVAQARDRTNVISAVSAGSLLALDPGASGPVFAAAGASSSAADRQWVAGALSFSTGKAATARLASVASSDAAAGTRLTAIAALARSDAPEAIDALLKALDPSTPVAGRIEVVRALARHMGDGRVRNALGRVAREDASDQVRLLASGALGSR